MISLLRKLFKPKPPEGLFYHGLHKRYYAPDAELTDDSPARYIVSCYEYELRGRKWVRTNVTFHSTRTIDEIIKEEEGSYRV